MNKSTTLLIIKIITIILIVIIFYIVVKNNIITSVVEDNFIDYNNEFKYMPANTRIMYENTGELPWNRHRISSSIPYDVKVKDEANKAYYYEFDNKTYNNKLKEVFQSNCEELIIASEGTSWSKWINPKTLNDEYTINKILRYYDKIFNFINTKLNQNSEMMLPGDNKSIQIVHDILLRYRYNIDNTSYFMFDIEMIFYREGKLQGKHVKIVAVTNGETVNVILITIIGVVSEDHIVLYPFTGLDSMNNVDFSAFVPTKNVTVDEDTKNSKENVFNINDKYLNSEIETVLYKKLLDTEIVEDIDISNNNYYPKKEELVKKDPCLL